MSPRGVEVKEGGHKHLHRVFRETLNPQSRTLKCERAKQVCVTAFSRTLDFYGFYGFITHTLSHTLSHTLLVS